MQPTLLACVYVQVTPEPRRYWLAAGDSGAALLSAAPLISVNSQAQTRQAAVSAKALAEPRLCLPTPIVAQPGPPGLPGAHSQARPERWTASLLGALGTPRRAARPGACTVVCCCCCCWHEQAAWTGAQMMGHESKVSARSARLANRIGPRYLLHLSQGLAAGWLPLQRLLRVVGPSLCNLLPGLAPNLPVPPHLYRP